MFSILDQEFRHLMVNQGYAALIGELASQLSGRHLNQTIGHTAYTSLSPYCQQALQGKPQLTEVCFQGPKQVIHLQVALTPVYLPDNSQYIALQAVNIADKELLKERLHESEQTFNALASFGESGVLTVEEDCILSANQTAATLLGFRHPNELLGNSLRHLLDLDSSSTHDTFPQDICAQLNSGPLNCYTRKHTREITLQAAQIPLFGSDAQLILLHEPCDTHVEKQVQVEHIDPLTSLYNRVGFSQQLEQLVELHRPFCLLYLDIDNFKNINDSLGHQIGDMVLKEVAVRLQDLFRPPAVIGHLGGDEFGVILPQGYAVDLVGSTSSAIINAINQPFDLQYFRKRLACSIGSVGFPKDGDTARILLQNADSAMYEAKSAGRNRLVQFHEQMNKDARKRLWVEIELQKALQQDGLEVWYQPKVDSQTRGIVGAEALVRWKHPVEGYVSPGEFIPIAERAGLVESIGQVVMREVFQAAQQWIKQGILPGKIAINLSPEQFHNTQLLSFMEKLLSDTHVDPKFIAFEITESTIMSESMHTLKMLKAIKALGFSLSIDDFGTGYSSLSYLAHFPVDEVKIDKAFIDDLDSLPRQVTVVENIINLGQALDLKVVAEGIESEPQARLLKKLNCDILQGFYFHTPQPRHAAEKLFAAQRKRR